MNRVVTKDLQRLAAALGGVQVKVPPQQFFQREEHVRLVIYQQDRGFGGVGHRPLRSVGWDAPATGASRNARPLVAPSQEQPRRSVYQSAGRRGSAGPRVGMATVGARIVSGRGLEFRL